MDKREENARNLDPNRFKSEAKTLSNMPGGPHNTSPVNFNMAAAEMDQSIGGQSIYDDFTQKGAYAQTGTSSLDPTKYQPSGMSNKPRGVGKNGGFNYGDQQQPTGKMQEGMEGLRQANTAMQKGLMAHPYLGIIGTPTPLEGNPTMMQGAQTDQTLGLVGFQSLDGVQPPGSTPTKIGKKTGKK